MNKEIFMKKLFIILIAVLLLVSCSDSNAAEQSDFYLTNEEISNDDSNIISIDISSSGESRENPILITKDDSGKYVSSDGNFEFSFYYQPENVSVGDELTLITKITNRTESTIYLNGYLGKFTPDEKLSFVKNIGTKSSDPSIIWLDSWGPGKVLPYSDDEFRSLFTASDKGISQISIYLQFEAVVDGEDKITYYEIADRWISEIEIK